MNLESILVSKRSLPFLGNGVDSHTNNKQLKLHSNCVHEMSKETQPANLRLLGSPVNLTYRNKKKDEKKNIRNRPRSALQNSCFTPDYQERYKRPFSADANPRNSNSNNLLKAFSIEVLHCSPIPKPVKVVPPTTEILRHFKTCDSYNRQNKDLGSNASDYGSEDTFISLGTKIKAKAQAVPKTKQNKNNLKYRNIAKKSKAIDNFDNIKMDRDIDDYNLEVKITEKAQGDTGFDQYDTYDKDFNSIYDTDIAFEHTKEIKYSVPDKTTESLTSEVNKAVDYYSRQLTKQQLSLVEEESTLSSISPENSLENVTNQVHQYEIENKANNDPKEEYKKLTQNFVSDKSIEPRTYKSFYDDFQMSKIEPYRSRLSSTGHTDESCKDSGYTDSGSNEDKPFRRTYSSPNSISALKKQDSANIDQPKSLDNPSYSSRNLGTYPPDKRSFEWSEPLNHSRLLYKDFFLKKEGNGPSAPQNTPNKLDIKAPEIDIAIKDISEDKSEYPSYLLNSTTKAYTSKVIEDYRKEIAAINNLHELTIKDIKIDSVSPTPLNIDKIFEECSGDFTTNSSTDSQEINSSKKDNYDVVKPNNIEKDISTISTKELIENYLKVKDNDISKPLTKNLKRFDHKLSSNSVENNLNNRYKLLTSKTDIPQVKNQIPTKVPLSARIESVQNDKDVDSWMSLTVSSPKNIENEQDNSPIITEDINPIDLNSPKANDEVKDLDKNASVLDIYSMLKEIESYGDNPVKVDTARTLEPTKKDDDAAIQKDNFMEIFDFLEKVEQSANEALSVVTNTTPQSIPKLELLLRLPQTELAQRLVTLSLQLEERSCCIALLQESLTNHKQQMVSKVSALEKQSTRNISKVKQECEEAIKRHQSFIDQLINDKKTLNHRIEQLVDERRTMDERFRRQAQAAEDRYKVELKNQHDKMAAAQQVARQRWVRQKAEKIKELTVKGLEGELRDMADRQQKEISDLKMYHAEYLGRVQAKHVADLEELRRTLEDEREAMLLKERQMASSRLEKQILELEVTYQEQRTRLIADMRAENERVASSLTKREKQSRLDIEKWKEDQEQQILEKKNQLEQDIAREREKMEEEIKSKRKNLEDELDRYKRQYEAEQNALFKKREKEIAAQYKLERDREIEKAIESIEVEAQGGRKEMQEALRRNKEQYEVELKELAQTEQATLKRYQDAQARVRQTEGKCAELEVTISQLETRNRLLTEKNSQLEQRAEDIRKGCEDAWKGKVDDLKREMADKEKTHDEQMHQLYAKVKIAVARKDSAIQALTRETSKAQEKITLLEQKLHQQRKDFLKHK